MMPSPLGVPPSQPSAGAGIFGMSAKLIMVSIFAPSAFS